MKLFCLGLFGTLLLVAGCGGSSSQLPKGSRAAGAAYAKCEPAGLKVVEVDVNGDKKPDIRHMYKGAQEICAQYDPNFDGKIDVTRFFGPDGKTVIREDHDYDFDGKIDDIAYYNKGVIERREIDTNYDDRIDTWLWCGGGFVTKIERDKNRNGYPDVFEQYDGGRLTSVRFDDNHDGQPDRWDFYRGGALIATGVDKDKNGEPDNIEPLVEPAASDNAEPLSCDSAKTTTAGLKDDPMKQDIALDIQNAKSKAVSTKPPSISAKNTEVKP